MTVQKRRSDGPGPGPGPHAKKQRTAKYQPKKFSINPLKARIRDLRRQLCRSGDNMPANVRVDKERELATCEHELAIAGAELEKQDMIPRYHKVRFFERQKAARFLKKAVKKLGENADPEAQAELERAKHVALVDLNYTLYYPLIRPYVSLYASLKSTDEKAGSPGTTRIGGDQTMWELVEKKMDEGALDALRNGLEWREAPASSAPLLVQSGSKPSKALTGTAAKKAKAKPAAEESGEESDGGFFE